MNIKIIENIKETLSVVIQCKEINDEVIRLKSHIKLFDNKLHAKKDNHYYFINSSDVLYFESVDNHTFLYTQEDVMEIKQRLYELEECLSDKDFIRISKSIIVNINKIKSLKPEINRTILVTMCNGELLYISRKYVQSVRQLLSIYEVNMKNKKNIQQFLLYMRNATAFCTTWFLIILLAYSYICHYQTISVNSLTKLLFLIIGGTFIFSILFTQIVIKKWNFTKRLSIFMLFISLYECIGFYWIGYFKGTGNLMQWLIFIGIVCVLYFICIAIYQRYSQKQGEMYTQLLLKYQQQRRSTDGQ